jgi:glycosyltransferase involved in cell wall biosynthesis
MSTNETGRPYLCFVGSMLGEHLGQIISQGEILSNRLVAKGFLVKNTSSALNPIRRMIEIIFTLIRYRKQIDILCVQVFSGLAFSIAEISTWLAYIFGYKTVLVLRGGSLPDFASDYPKRVNKVLRQADAVIAPSTYLASVLIRCDKEIQVIPNIIDISLLQFRKRSQILTSLVWLRSFHHIYNPTLGIKAIALLISEFPEINLTMIGSDKGDGSLKETLDLTEKLGLSKQLCFLGKVAKKDVPESLQLGDIFINTTNVDNTPVSIIEAMACGLCIVSTNVGGIPYLLDDGKDALLVPPDDPRAMASAIRRILTEPDLAERLSMNARKKAEQFDWSVILPQWERLFDAVIKTND